MAGFIGSPKMNFITGQPARDEGAETIGVRPEHMVVSQGSGLWRGKVGVSEHLGSDTFVRVQVDGIGGLNARVSGEMPVRHGDNVWLTPESGKIYKFDSDGLAIS